MLRAGGPRIDGRAGWHPGHPRPAGRSLNFRAGAQIGLGEHAQVAAAANVIGDRFPNVFDDYLWAEQLARCIPLAEKDPQMPQDERDRLAREYADRSIALLRSAQQKKSKDLPKIHTQPAFQPLRGRADFQKLLAEVAKPAK